MAADPGPRITLLPGDGIGPEIVAAARRLMEAIGGFDFEEWLIGGASIDAHGAALTDEALEACRRSDAVLLGAVGGPKWDTTDPGPRGPSRDCSGCVRAWACTRTFARCVPAPRWSTPARCARIELPAPTCWWSVS